MKALVTGGAGFIGSNLVDFLIKSNWEVDIIDDLSTGKEEYINKVVLDKYKFFKGSICDMELLEPIFKNGHYDVVFHLAAWPRVPRSIEDPVGTNMVNVDGTLNILQMVRKYEVPKLVYSSSSSVYGDQETPVMVETMIPSPKSPYALQKLIGELYCTLFARLFNLSIVSLRYFNVYGNRQATEGAYCLVIGKFLQQLKKGEPMTIYGDGLQTRAYTYIADVVKANVLAAEIGVEKGNNLIVNIGTADEHSVNDIADRLDSIPEHRTYVVPNPRGEFEERRKVANNDKARLELGWVPEIDFDKGIKKVLMTE